MHDPSRNQEIEQQRQIQQQQREFNRQQQVEQSFSPETQQKIDAALEKLNPETLSHLREANSKDGWKPKENSFQEQQEKFVTDKNKENVTIDEAKDEIDSSLETFNPDTVSDLREANTVEGVKPQEIDRQDFSSRPVEQKEITTPQQEKDMPVAEKSEYGNDDLVKGMDKAMEKYSSRYEPAKEAQQLEKQRQPEPQIER